MKEIKAMEEKSTADAIDIIETANSTLYEKDIQIRQVFKSLA
jgi:hypothetical protein